MERGVVGAGAWGVAPPHATPSENVPSGIVEQSVGDEGKQGAPREYLLNCFRVMQFVVMSIHRSFVVRDSYSASAVCVTKKLKCNIATVKQL